MGFQLQFYIGGTETKMKHEVFGILPNITVHKEGQTSNNKTLDLKSRKHFKSLEGLMCLSSKLTTSIFNIIECGGAVT